MKRYIDIMEKCGVKTYSVSQIEKSTVELFFIKKKLDMRRMCQTSEVSISVYKDIEKDGKTFRGMARVVANTSMSDEEIQAKIESAEYAAQYALNPFYELHEKTVSEEVVQDSDLRDLSLSDIADKFVCAAYEADKDEKAFINSFELFVTKERNRIITSMGTDVSYSTKKVSGEFVAQCTTPQDVETYMNFKYDTLALKEIKALVEDTLKMTADRAAATKMPKAGKVNVVLSGRYVPTITSYYLDRSNAALIYPKYSNFKVGDAVQGEDIKGDRFNIKLGVTEPFSSEGIRMVERPLLENGVLKTIHGGQRFAYYLGVEQTGDYEKVIVEEGTTSFEDMLAGPCLHVVNFSDFQMDALDGHFAGEIRLAYYYDGKGNRECVTGGSINGSFLTSQMDVVLSKENQELAEYVGPKAIMLKNVSVAGE